MDIEFIVCKHTADLPKVNLSLVKKDIENAISSRKYGTPDKNILDQLALACNDKALIHAQWSLLAGRIQIEIIHSEVPELFSESTIKMQPILNSEYFDFVCNNSGALDEMIRRDNDYNFDIFSVSTLRKSYLAHLKVDDKSFLMETPQYMYLRVASYLHYPNLKNIEETYISLSNGDYAHATPTLFNSGLKKPQLSSCFLLSVGDEMKSITKAWHDQAIISTNSGGLGCDYSQLRHSEIGQHGFSRGIVPWLKITNEILKTVDQCFGPDTIVYCSTGPKKISEIVSGDKMIAEDGSFNRVASVFQYNLNPTVELRKFKIKHYIEPVIVASCHPMLSFKFSKGESYSKLTKKLETGKIVPEYIDVSDLTEDYFVALPIPKGERDMPKITMEDCRIYGIMLGDGWASKKRNEFKVYLNDGTKAGTAEFVEEYLTHRNIHFWTALSNTNCRSYGWTPDAKVFPFTRQSFYTSGSQKTMTPAMMQLPVDKIMQIFKGLMETDGSYRSGGEIQISQTSRVLIDCLRYILLRAGIPTSGNVADKRGSVSHLKRGGTITTQQITYNLRIPKTGLVCHLLDREDPSNKLSYFVYDEKIWSRVVTNTIMSSDEIKRDGLEAIFDLEMEGSNEQTKNYMTCIGQAHNGGKRKGSGTIYLRDFHIDIKEFIELRDEGPEEMRAKDLFLGLMISDLFMKRVEKDEIWSLFCPNRAKGLADKWGNDFENAYIQFEKEGIYSSQIKARDLWENILKMQIKKGMPFILFMDACNAKSNQKHSGVIRCSNLCVAGDTFVLTDRGNLKIEDLKDVDVNVWNGKEWSQVTVRKTGVKKQLLNVKFSNGVILSCTPQHKFHIRGIDQEVDAENLKVGDAIIKWDVPVVENVLENSFTPYLLNIDERVTWVGGYIAAYGRIIKDEAGDSLKLFNTENENLRHIRLVLLTLGIDTTITEEKNYISDIFRKEKNGWCLNISPKGVQQLNNLDFKTLQLEHRDVPDEDNIVRVESVSLGNPCATTYCFTEPKRHMGVFNGILTGQCTEILEVTNEKEIASCILASLSLNRCVEYNSLTGRSYFNFDKLEKLTRELVRNLNQVIDRNYYPDDIPEIKYSNMLHRPLGIGVQGLADAFALLDISWIVPNPVRTRDEPEDAFITSPNAKKLNDQIFETIYFASVKESIEQAKEHGPYPSFHGSPASEGKFQFDLWEDERNRKIVGNVSIKKRGHEEFHVRPKSRYTIDQWDNLRQDMMKYGLRNSLLTTIMPTASSAHILGNMEAVEPFTELIYARTVLSGQFLVINKHLIRDMEDIGMWNDETVRKIIGKRGSISEIHAPLSASGKIVERLNFLKLKYATVFEIPQRTILELAADRGVNIDQTQSQNCFMARPTKKKLNAYFFRAWELGLKTGMYYLRQKALTDPINFTVDATVDAGTKATANAGVKVEKREEGETIKKRRIECTDDICTSCMV